MSAIVLLAVLSLISIGLSLWLAVWLWRQGGKINKVGACAAIIVAGCFVIIWGLGYYLHYLLTINY